MNCTLVTDCACVFCHTVYPNTLIPNPEDNGDSLLIHASASTHQHGEVPAAPETWSSILTYRLRRDGFVFASAGANNEATFTTTAIVWGKSSLLINANCSGGGSVRVGVLDSKSHKSIEGFDISQSVAMTTDSVAESAKWSSGRSIQELSGHQLQLQVELGGAARLYSFRGDMELTYTME